MNFNILFEDQIDPVQYVKFIQMSNEIKIKRNRLIIFTFAQVFASLFGMTFFLFRRTLIYIVINTATSLIGICGCYGSIKINSFCLLTHCILTISLGGGFFIFSIFDDLLTDNSTYGDSKRVSDHLLLWIFSLPYVYDVYAGMYNFSWLRMLSNTQEQNIPLMESQSIKNEERIEMKNIDNPVNSDDYYCIICCEKKKDVAFLPCGHISCCEACEPKVTCCPLCRNKKIGTIKVYI